MLTERENQEFLVLQIIAQSISPVGSGYLSRELHRLENPVS